MTSKLRSRPPIASADDFIAGADQQTAAVEPRGASSSCSTAMGKILRCGRTC